MWVAPLPAEDTYLQITMYANHPFDGQQPAPGLAEPGRRAERRLRRVARRHGRLSWVDYVAFWRAHWSGRQCCRSRSRGTGMVTLRVVLVIMLLAAGLTAGMLLA